MTARRWTKRALSFRADRWLTLTSPPPIASLNFSKIYNLKTIFNKFTTISDGSRPDSHILWFETINAPEMVYSRPYTTSCGLILQNHLGVVSRLIEETALCMTFYFTAYFARRIAGGALWVLARILSSAGSHTAVRWLRQGGSAGTYSSSYPRC